MKHTDEPHASGIALIERPGARVLQLFPSQKDLGAFVRDVPQTTARRPEGW